VPTVDTYAFSMVGTCKTYCIVMYQSRPTGVSLSSIATPDFKRMCMTSSNILWKLFRDEVIQLFDNAKMEMLSCRWSGEEASSESDV
jgi:hypothetical protein